MFSSVFAKMYGVQKMSLCKWPLILQDNSTASRTFYHFSHFHDWKIDQQDAGKLCLCHVRNNKVDLLLLLLFARPLTLVNVQEGLAKLAGQQRLGQIPEELLHHVSHVVRRLVLVGDRVRRELALLPQRLDARLHARLAKQSHLRADKEADMLRFFFLRSLGFGKHAGSVG